MAQYKAPITDMKFIVNDVFHSYSLWSSMSATAEVTEDVVSAILEESAKIAENVLFPINRSGDEEGCQFNNGCVKTPTGFSLAFNTMAEGGWIGLGGDPEYGGQGMPKVLVLLFEEMLMSANSAFSLYPILSSGATLAIHRHAVSELKDRYLPNLYSGRWSGTMCLTESQAGSDLAIIRTKAIPDSGGSYKISGTKIFITGGEHDLTENIIHLVLAKLPDAPAGAKGISLFLVPKKLVNADGSLGEHNAVSCGSIEHKMGIKGSSTCVMNFDEAKGWLVGELNNGLNCMFTMMNYERLSIGIQGLASGEMAYQHAVEYAKERLQGRSTLGPVNPKRVADSLLVHPDVRRMLMIVRAQNESARAFGCYVATQLDIAKSHPDDKKRKKADALVALLTPVAKAYFTDRGFESCVLAQQVFGGHGYIREWGAEQLVRDARIAQIYEGTNGIQALDLVGRKVLGSGGQLLQYFIEDIEESIADADADGDGRLQEFVMGLQRAKAHMLTATEYLLLNAKQDPQLLGAVCVDYLELVGLVGSAYVWLKMANVAVEKTRGDDFYGDKLTTGRFFLTKILPKTDTLIQTIQAGANNLMIDDRYFN